MKTVHAVIPAFLLTTVLLAVSALGELTGFRAVEVKNDCKVQLDGTYAAIEEGKSYPFGSTVKTGRNSSLVMELSAGNTFQLLARTKLTIKEGVRDSKLKKLNLKIETGSVSLKLDDFPKDHQLEVETPTAVCGAVGTRFVVSFDAADANQSEPKSRFECSKGEVFVSSRFKVGGSSVDAQGFDAPSVKAGSALVATIHEGLENSYTDITVNRGSVDFSVGGDGKKSTRFSVAPKEGKSARFVCSVEKSKSDVDMVAVKVRSGEIVSQEVETKTNFFTRKKTTVVKSEESILPTDGAVLVKDQGVVEPKDPKDKAVIEQYIAATQVEGKKHTQLEQLKQIPTPTMAQQAQIKTVQVELKTAASKATTLRKSLLRKRMTTLQRHIRKGAGRVRMRRP